MFYNIAGGDFVKVKTNRKHPKAARMFTDRKEYRDAFRDAYETVKSELNCESDVHVLYYYGIGGIGKTHLLNKLKDELKEQVPSPMYIHVDLGVCQERITVLEGIKKNLADNYKFSFSLFELGVYVYARKVGAKAESIDVKQFIASSPVLSLILQISKELPVVGVAAKILDIATTALTTADKASSIILTRIKKHDKKLKELDSMDSDGLYRYLSHLFALDMAENLEKKTKEPFVFFLDTYEKLISKPGNVGEPLLADEWIRGDDGLIQCIPKTLWVIAGRDRLDWETFDPEWRDALEQHRLDMLSDKDSSDFLKSTGITDEKLISQIFELTKGTPLCLDLCVDTFFRIRDKGITPDISMFGNNSLELTERFIRYMDNEQKDLSLVLAYLDKWDDALVIGIAPDIIPNFSFSAYERTKDYSYVTYDDDSDSYCMSPIVGNVLKVKCPPLLKKRIGTVLFDKFSKVLEKKDFLSPDFSTALTYVTQAGLLLCEDRDELCEFFTKHIDGNLISLAEAGMFECADNIFDMLLKESETENDVFRKTIMFLNARLAQIKGDCKKACELADESLKLQMELCPEIDSNTLAMAEALATMLSGAGKNEEAIKKTEFVLEHRRRLLGEDAKTTINSLLNLGVYLYRAKKYREAFETSQQAYEKYKKVLGENCDSTIRAMHDMSVSLYCLEEYRQALDLQEKALEKSIKYYGEDNPEALMIMSSLAFTLSRLDEPEKALELRKTVLEKRLRHLRKNHNYTISSMNDVARSLNSLGKYEEAADMYKKIYEAHCSVSGENNQDALSALDSAATIIINSLKKPEEALPLFIKIFEKKRELYGTGNEKLLVSMKKLAACYDGVKEYTKAQALREEIKTLTE